MQTTLVLVCKNWPRFGSTRQRDGRGGLFVPFDVCFARNNAVCVADAARGAFLSGLCKTASFGAWISVSGGLKGCYSHHLRFGLGEITLFAF